MLTVTRCILPFELLLVNYFSFCSFFHLSPSANGGSHHVVRAEAAEDVDGTDHLAVQVCLPGPHPVPEKLPPHLSPDFYSLILHDTVDGDNGT